MAYTMLKNNVIPRNYRENSLEYNVITFIRNDCEKLRFDESKAMSIDAECLDNDGKSIKHKQIPCNMEKDIDRLVLENAIVRFLNSKSKEDAFDVFFCYLDMYVSDYTHIKKILDELSSYENDIYKQTEQNAGYYTDAVYRFCLGINHYKTDELLRRQYNDLFGDLEPDKLAHHFLEFWGAVSMFQNIKSFSIIDDEVKIQIQDMVNISDSEKDYDIANQNFDGHLFDISFSNIYKFATVLNARWGNNVALESFNELSLEYKMLNINQVKSFVGHMRKLGCFEKDKSLKSIECFSDEEMKKIGYLENHRWLKERYEMGWIYGTPTGEEREILRQHKDMIPEFSDSQFVVSYEDAKKNFERLEKSVQDKDTDPMKCMLLLYKMMPGSN